MKKLCVIAVFSIIFFGSSAQRINALPEIQEDYSVLRLPPLEVLFENAKKSASVEFFNLRKQEQESLLKTEKRSWMKYFRATASYQYGKSGVLSYSEDNLSLYQFSDIEQSLYSVGGSVSIPLDDLFDRPNRVKRQKLEMRATEVEVEKWYDEQKLRIVQAYTSAEQLLAVLKIKNEALTFLKAQYKLAENNFISGRIDEQELGQQKSSLANTLTDYEQTKASLRNVLLQLEILSKTKFLSQ